MHVMNAGAAETIHENLRQFFREAEVNSGAVFPVSKSLTAFIPLGPMIDVSLNETSHPNSGALGLNVSR